MSESKHTKNLVNIQLARFIIQELMAENAKLRKMERAFNERLDLNLTQKDLDNIDARINENLDLLKKMEVVLEMENLYNKGILPQGYTFDAELSGLNNPLNR